MGGRDNGTISTNIVGDACVDDVTAAPQSAQKRFTVVPEKRMRPVEIADRNLMGDDAAKSLARIQQHQIEFPDFELVDRAGLPEKA